MTYCNDIDLLTYRQNILSLGVSDWQEQREQAYLIINRVIEAKWYRAAAESFSIDYTEVVFNPDLIETGSLTRLECFKTLELAYMYLKKDSQESDGFARLEEEFRTRYNEELSSILAVGINYDWDSSGAISSDERYITTSRRQHKA